MLSWKFRDALYKCAAGQYHTAWRHCVKTRPQQQHTVHRSKGAEYSDTWIHPRGFIIVTKAYIDVSSSTAGPHRRQLHNRTTTMKLTTALAAAFAGCAAAAQQAAEVYIVPQPNAVTTSVPRSLARLILMQRLAQGEGFSTIEIPDSADLSEVSALMNDFGKTTTPLFTHGAATPRQLVLMVEGMTEEQIHTTGKAFDMPPTLTISNPPSHAAHEKLAANDFWDIGVTKKDCSIYELTNPSMDACWSGKSAYMRLNAEKVLATGDLRNLGSR